MKTLLGVRTKALERNHLRVIVCLACFVRPFDAQAVNHGIPAELLESVVSKGRELFALPKAVKAQIKVAYALLTVGPAAITVHTR